MLLLPLVYIRAFKFKDTSASAVIHPIACQCSIARYRSLTISS